MQRGILGVVCALVVAVYVCAAHSGIPLSGRMRMAAADNFYNLLVQGFRAGQLNLTREVPPALAQLPDPYDPRAYASYGQEVGDMSYYKGKLYIYFGVTPAVLLFWPYVAQTGHYLLQRDAVVIFCIVGFLISVGLLYALWQRCFAEVSVAVVAAGGLALGLATGVPIMLARSDVYEVSISCGYALTMLALTAIWKALHDPERRGRWLATASLAYGLAVGARPSLVFGAVILLVPVARSWRERRPVSAPLMAAVLPIALTGLGLMLYNLLRFDSPFEFGVRYQLAGDRGPVPQFFSLRYLWFNFRVYFLELARWSRWFPFVRDISTPPRPVGHAEVVEHAFGILGNIPLVWLALAAPLAWRDRAESARWILRWFVMAIALLFGICALTIGLFWSAAIRYEVEFLPALVLLAVIGLLSVERASTVRRPFWQGTVRCVWSLLLGFSVALNLLASVKQSAEWHDDLGAMLIRHGKVQEAIGHYEQALRLEPHLAAAHNNWGEALFQEGKMQEAIGQFEQALRIEPDFVAAHNNLGSALAQSGRMQQAMEHWEQALRLNPDYAGTHYNLGLALEQLGRTPEAMEQYEQVLRIDPGFADGHFNLGLALARTGKLQEAMEHWKQTLRVRPDFAEAYYNLGVALERLGRVQEAIQHYEQALRLKPDFVQARNALAHARAPQ